MPFRPESCLLIAWLRSLPASTGALYSSYMATSSSHLSSVFAHGQHSNLTPSIAHSLNAGTLSSDLMSYPGVPAQATRCADPLGGVQNRNVSDEWLQYLLNGNLDGIIATDVTADFLQTVSWLNSSSRLVLYCLVDHESAIDISHEISCYVDTRFFELICFALHRLDLHPFPHL